MFGQAYLVSLDRDHQLVTIVLIGVNPGLGLSGFFLQRCGINSCGCVGEIWVLFSTSRLRRCGGRNSQKAKRCDDGEYDAAGEVHTGQNHNPLFQATVNHSRKSFFGLYCGVAVGLGVGISMSVFVYRSNALNVPSGFVPSQFALSAHTA